MCNLCNGTHVVHEVNNFGYRTICCPVCGPLSDEIWNARINGLLEWVKDLRSKEEMIK